MKKRVLVSAFVLCGLGGAAFAQSTGAPAGTPAEAATPTAEREVVRSPETPAVPRQDNSSATGDDKINGLEVPRMKDQKDGGRQQ